VLAEVRKEEPFAGAELADGQRGEDFAALGQSGDAGGEDHRLAKEIAVLLNRLAGVEADADGQRLVRSRVAFSEGLL